MKKALFVGALLGVMGSAHAQLLYSNGPVVGANGLSVLTPPASTFGLGIQISAGNSAADNFTVTGPGWNVTSLAFFSYQTGATAFTFTGATWSIVSGDVNAGTVLASGTSSPVTNGGLMGYRVLDTALTATNRPIYRVSVDIPDITLAPGDYWLRWSLAGTVASGPWQPPTANGVEGNLHQLTATTGSYTLWVDAGNGLTAEAPFEIYGAPIPEPSTYALMLAGGLAVAAFVRRRRAD